MQDRYVLVAASLLMQPCIDSWNLRMSLNFKHFHNPIPNCLAVKRLFHRHTIDMLGL
jgi:hypothetical protein